MFRIILSVLAIGLYTFGKFVAGVSAPLISGNLAGAQFDNTNTGYFAGQLATYFNGSGESVLSTFLLIGVLIAIWYSPTKKMLASLVVLFALLAVSPSYAYYDQKDWTEPFFILPNESAFFIPDVGANKDSQSKFGSQDYYESNKIAAKRFTIPHQKLSGSGTWSDYYVPAGRLIVVDRTPYNREWTAAGHRGTSTRDESFPCQSSEGLNITVEVGVAASVFEENAAKFLYRYGVNTPQGDRTKPEVIFTSVYYGRSLREVMDTVGRGEVGVLVCNELSTRTLDKANGEAGAILKAVQEKATAWFASYGISIDYIGWAGTFSFDPNVQKAINDKYEADKIAPVLSTLQAQADIKVKEGLGTGLATRGLPANLVALPNLDSFLALFKSK